MSACVHGHSKPEVGVHFFEIPIALWRLNPQMRHGGPIEQDLQLVRFSKAFYLLIPIPRQADLDFILAVPRKCIRQQDTTARTEREAFNRFLLRTIGSDTEGVAAGLAHR